jgi:hypothetical protein
MDELARTIGVAYTQGRHNPFVRALQRCVMFGVAEHIAVQPIRTLAVRKSLPSLPQRHLGRLPNQLQIAHHDWMQNLRESTHSPSGVS